MVKSVLLVDSGGDGRDVFTRLGTRRHEVTTAASFREAVARLVERSFDIVICRAGDCPAIWRFVEFVRAVHGERPLVIVHAAASDVALHDSAGRLRAAVLTSPIGAVAGWRAPPAELPRAEPALDG